MKEGKSETNIALQTLKSYWGYDAFRPPQDNIIASILSGKDTLALLPTGGGKSICFQVPGLIFEGVCLVISPLIALMKDQVENLVARNIQADALYSGQAKQEQDAILNQAVCGKLKFLYISPERLASEDFRGWLKNMPLSLLAVDEAHCISQWGFDFRPEYREIAEIRSLFPEIPILALTASATPEVVKDMIESLQFKKNHQVFSKSFERQNLSYLVRKIDNKHLKILEGIKKIKGTGIVYTRNRRGTEELAKFLLENGISADFYHAGLDVKSRTQKQNDWIKNKTRVMVCTNAFGMGIDKPDVRFVIHNEPPDCLESYYQEAGRAGRDEKASYCVLFYNENDIEKEETNIEERYPENAVLNQVYQLVCNQEGLVEGSGKGVSFSFEIEPFCTTHKLRPIIVHHCISLLHKQGYWHYSESGTFRSSLKINLTEQELYGVQVKDEFLNELFLAILRVRGGYFDFITPIDELKIALILNIPEKKVCQTLELLHKKNWVFYQPKSSIPKITLLEPRYPKINPDRTKIEFLKKRNIARFKSLIKYLENAEKCRNALICEYFNSPHQKTCGSCDNCRKASYKTLTDTELKKYQNFIKERLTIAGDQSMESLKKDTKPKDWQNLNSVLEWMLRNEWIEKKKGGVLIWKKEK